MSRPRRVLVVPDIQLPFQNQRQVNSLAGFIRALEFDDVMQCGDLVDFTSFGRWVKGKRGEYDREIQTHVDATKRTLEKLHITKWKRGNHDERLDKYIEENAPALRGLVNLSMEAVFDLDELGVTYLREMYEFAPDWWLAHGDEGGLSSVPGVTALGLAKKVGASVVCGHGHRAGILPSTESINGKPTRQIYGVEVGHMMDMSQASYLKAGFANWQSAFGVFDISGTKVQPQVIFVSQTGGFMFEGSSWEDGRLKRGSTK